MSAASAFSSMRAIREQLTAAIESGCAHSTYASAICATVTPFMRASFSQRASRARLSCVRYPFTAYLSSAARAALSLPEENLPENSPRASAE